MSSYAGVGLDCMAMLRGGTGYNDDLPYSAAERSWGSGSGTGELVIVLEYLAVKQRFDAAMVAVKLIAVAVAGVAVLMIQVEGEAVSVTRDVAYASVTAAVFVFGSTAAFVVFVVTVAVEDDWLLWVLE